MYIQASGLCSGCHIDGCDGEAFESRVWLCVGRRIKRAFAMIDVDVGGGVGAWLVVINVLC